MNVVVYMMGMALAFTSGMLVGFAIAAHNLQ